MYGQEIKRIERPMHYRFLSVLLAFAIALSCVVVGITPLKAKAAGTDSTPYQFRGGSFAQVTGNDADDVNTYVNEQKNNIYSYYASYKVPKLSDSILVLGNDLFSVYTYVDGNADNGTGVKNRGYFFSDTDINVIGNIQAPFDGSASIDTSVWHKKALDFSTSVLAGYSVHAADDPFANFVDAVNVERTSAGSLMRYDGKNGRELKGFFPDNIYVEWTDSINWDLYDIQFALRDFLADSNFDYFKNSAVKDSWDSNGIVWVDNTTVAPNYYQTAASSPKNIYLPTKNSEFKANSALAGNTNTSAEDIHPFLYLCTETLPTRVTSDNNGSYIEDWFKGVDQYGVNFSSSNLSYSVSGNAGDCVKIDSNTGKITLSNIPTDATKTAIITVTAKTANSQYPVQTISFPITVGEVLSYSDASRYTTWDSELDEDNNFYKTQFQSGSTAVSGQANYDISLDIPTSLPITFDNVDYNTQNTKIMKALNYKGGYGGNTTHRFSIDETKIGDDKSKIDLSQVITQYDASSGHSSYSEAWDTLSSNTKMGITLIARIYKSGSVKAEDKGGFLKSSTLESGGTNGGSGYTLQLAKNLTEGWYAIFEDRDSKPSYHIFYLARNSENPIYDSNGNAIAVLANTTLNIVSTNYEITELHYYSPKQAAAIKTKGYSYNANGEAFGETAMVEMPIVSGRNLEVKKYSSSVSFFPENIYFNWAATNIKTLPKTQTGIYKIDIGGSFTADDFITINGVRFAGNTTEYKIANSIYDNRTQLTGYTVTHTNNSYSVTLTEKTNGVGIPEIFVYSKNGTATLTVTQLGAAYDTAFKIKTATNYYKDYAAKDADNNLKSFYVTDGSNNYVISDSAIENASVFDNITLGSYAALNKNFNPNVEGKKVDYFPFLYKYSLTGSLFSGQPATIDSGLVDIADGVITNFKPSVIKGSISKDVEKEIGFTGIDQYGVYYQALKYDLVDTNTKADISAPSGVSFNAGKITVNNSLLANPVTDLTVKITALTRNDDSVEGNTDKTTVIYIPLKIYKEYTLKFDVDDVYNTETGFPDGAEPVVDTFDSEKSHTYSEFISNVPTPTKDGALFVGWYDVDDPEQTIITADTPITNSNHVLKPLWSTDNYTINYLYANGAPVGDSRTVLPVIDGHGHPIFSDAVTLYEVYDQAKNLEEGRGRFIGWNLGTTSGTLVTGGIANEDADKADGADDNVINVYATFEKEYEFVFHYADDTDTDKIYVAESELNHNLYATYIDDQRSFYVPKTDLDKLVDGKITNDFYNKYLADKIVLGELADIYGTKITYSTDNSALLPDGFVCMFVDPDLVYPWAIRENVEAKDATYTEGSIKTYPADKYYSPLKTPLMLENVGLTTVEEGSSGELLKISIASGKTGTTFKDAADAYIEYINSIKEAGTADKTLDTVGPIHIYTAIEKVFTLTYDANDGDFGKDKDDKTILSKDYEVAAGNALTGSIPEEPTRDGYAFIGWYTDSSCEDENLVDFDEYVMPGEDTILYAGWKEVVELNVTFDPNGGEFTPGVDNVIEETYGEKYILPTANPTRDNYTFDGWFTSETSGTEITADTTVNITKDTTVYAQWTPDEFTITYNLNDGTDPGNPTTYTVESDDITLVEPTKAGYTFLGWTYTGQTEPTKDVTIPTGSSGNKEFTANWQKDTYTITYILNDGTVATANPTEYQVDTETFTLNNPTKDGYTFLGWTGTDLAEASKSVSVEKGSTGNRTYTATWAPNDYVVTFIYNDGVTTSTTKDVTYTEPYGELPTPTRLGYTFEGWYADPDFETAEVKADTIYNIKDNSNLYAKWDKVSILINFDKNGAPAQTQMDPQTFWFAVADNLKANTYTREGYDFVGWSKVSTATEKDYADKASFTFAPSTQEELDVAVTNGITLYAVWVEKTATLTYDANGGTGAPDPQTLKYTEVANVSATAPTRAGYKFLGWADANDATVAKYTLEDPQYKGANEIPTDATVYAVWELETYEIEYDLDGGSLAEGVTNPEEYTILTDTFTLSNPTKTGYKFAGWTGTGLPSATEEVSVAKGSTGDRSYKATWEANQYEVVFRANGGSGDPMTNESFKYDETKALTANSYIKTGYSFVGWSLTTNGSVAYADEAEVSNLTSTDGAVVDLYALWTANKYTATFDANGGTFASGTTEEIEETYDSNYILPTANPIYKNNIFKGWFTGETDGTEITTSTKYLVDGDTTVYAHWDPYTITGTAAANKTEMTYGTSDPIVITATPGDKPTPNTNLTYQWYEVTGESGSETYTIINGATDKTFTVPATTHSGDHTYVCVITAKDTPIDCEASVTTDPIDITVNKATITATPTEGQGKDYCATEPTLTYTYTGNVTGETPVFTGAIVRETSGIDDPVGEYDITQGTLALDTSSAVNENYVLEFTPGVFTIKYHETTAVPTYSPNGPAATNWYNFTTKEAYLVAPEGYLVKIAGSGEDFAASSELLPSTTTDGAKPQYILKKIDNGAITDVKTMTDPYYQDLIKPIGSVTVAPTTWTEIVNAIDFLNLFYKEAIGVALTTADETGGSGVAQKHYIIASEGKTIAQLDAINTWEPYPADGTFTIDKPDGNKVVYLRVIDKAGNISYISSAGMVLDTVAPEITAVPSFTEGEWTTASEVTIDVTNILEVTSGIDSVTYSYDGITKDSVTVSSLGENNSFKIPDTDIPDGEYKIIITATDKAGNVGTSTIQVKRESNDAVVISDPVSKTVTYGDATADFTVTAESVSGIKSIKWQKLEKDGTTWTDVTEGITSIEKGSKLTVSNPTVVADNGDRYRAIVTTNAKNEITTNVETPAVLTVLQRELVIAPTNVEYEYGTPESLVTTGLPWDYVSDDKKPINNDDVKIIGKFVREDGVMPDKYTITSGTGDDKIRLDPSVAVNGNYFITINPSAASFEIIEYTPDANATLVGEKPYGWYIKDSDEDGVRITAPENYKISTSNALTDNTWSDYLTVPDGEYNEGYTYYLKYVGEDDDQGNKNGAISVAKKTEAFKQDTVNPTASVSITNPTKVQTKDGVDYYGDKATATITNSDETSKVKTVEYYYSETKIDDPSTITTGWTEGASTTIENGNTGYVYAKVTDNAGNVTYAGSNKVCVDTVNPTVTDTNGISDKWIKDPTQNVVVSVSDDYSGLDTVTYKVGAGETNTATVTDGKITIPASELPEGDYTVVVTAKDNCGNDKDLNLNIKKDTTAPQAKITVDESNLKRTLSTLPIFGKFFNETVKVTIEEADETTEYKKDISGIAKVEYYVANKELSADEIAAITTWSSAEKAKETVSVDPDNKYVVYGRITDNAGNVSTVVASYGFVTDKTVPTITNNAAATWYSNNSDKVTVTVTDNLAGLYEVKYKINDGTEQTATLTDGKFEVSVSALAEGTNTITVTAEDNSTNKNDSYSITVKKDTVAPTASVSITDPTKVQTKDGIDYYGATATATITNSDATSGVDTVKYYFSTTKVDEPSSITAWSAATDAKATIANGNTGYVYAKVTDKAGLVTYAESKQICVDTVDPTVTDTNSISGKWIKDPKQDVVVSVSDDYSGLDTVTYTVNGGTPVTATVKDGKITIPAENLPEGEYKVTVIATDNCGNDKNLDIDIKKDTTAPQAKITVDESNLKRTLSELPIFGKFFNETVKVTIEEADETTEYKKDTSGIAKVEYYVANKELSADEIAAITTWSSAEKAKETVSVDPDNKYVVYGRITDNAGNVSTVVASYGFVTDKTVPTITNNAAETWYSNNSDKVAVTVTDNLAGLYEVKYKINDGTEQTATLTDGKFDILVSALAEGTNTITITAEDNSTNVNGTTEKPYTITVKKDTVAPTASVSVTAPEKVQTKNDTDYYGGTATVTIANSDVTSGVKKVEYYYSTAPISDPSTITTGWTEGTSTTIANGNTGYVYAKVTDNAGHVTYAGSNKIAVDTVDPTVTDTNSVSGKWIKDPNQNVEVTVSDDYSGLDTVTYTVNGGEEKTATVVNGKITIPAEDLPEGEYTVSVTAKDNCGNDTTLDLSIKKDTTAPQAKITVDESKLKRTLNNLTFGKFFNETVKVTIEEADETTEYKKDISGIAKVEYYVANKELSADEIAAITTWSSAEKAKETVSVDPDNKYVVYGRITDNAGNVSTVVASYGFVTDKTVPTITNNAAETWYSNNSDKVTVTVTDNLAGLYEVKYKINDGTEQTATLTDGKFDILVSALAEGTNTITITAEDNSTNVNGTTEKPYTITVKKDTTAPTVTDTRTDPTAWITTQDVVVSVADNANGSGLDTVTYKVGNGETKTAEVKDGKITIPAADIPNGTNTVTVIATDKCGNKTTETLTVKKDTVAPTVEDTDNVSETWIKDPDQDVKVSVADNEGGSGIDPDTVTYTVNGGTPQPATVADDGTITIPTSNFEDGEYDVVVTATDNCGNTKTLDLDIWKDTKAPDATVSVTDPTAPYQSKDGTDYYGTEPTVTIDSSDETSGVDTVEYYFSETPITDPSTIDDDDWTPGTTITLEDGDTGYVYAKVTDKAGNVTYEESNKIVVDKEAPTVKDKDDVSGTWITNPNQDVKVTVEDNEGGSGIKEVTYTVDGGTPVTVPVADDGTITIPADKLPDGEYKVEVIATDNCGNETKLDLDISKNTTVGPIAGTVTDDNDEPVPEATVELLDKNGNPVKDPDGKPITTTTNSDGEYVFDNIPDGEYQIKVTPKDTEQLQEKTKPVVKKNNVCDADVQLDGYDVYEQAEKDVDTDVEIRVEVKVEGLVEFDNVNATSKTDISKVLGKSIDKADLDVILDGGRIEVVMTIKEIPQNVPNEKRIAADNLLLAKHVEITIVKSWYDMYDVLIDSMNITRTADPISFVVPIGEFEKEGRQFYVYGEHGDRVPATKTPDGDGVLITPTVEFATQDFSIFSIAYAPEEVEEIVNTRDESPIISMSLLSGLSALMFVAIKHKKDELEED